MQQRLERTQEQAASLLPSAVVGSKPEDIFYHLLRNGKVEEALCVFRVHAPFNEFDSEQIPSLLSRALPHARKHGLLSFMAFQSLLNFLEEEITLSEHSTALLSELAETQTNEILLRILPDEYETISSPSGTTQQQEVTQTLQLSVHIARCGRLTTLQRMVQETLDLVEQFHLVRPARILYCLDDNAQVQSCVVRRFEMDCEAFLWRIIDAQMAENTSIELVLLQQAQQWCCRGGNLEWENCVVNFLTAHPALLAEQPLCVLRLVDMLQTNDQLRTKAVALCISRFTAPFPAKFWEMLQHDATMWEKEMKQMRIREVCARYLTNGAFDLAKHLHQMQHHICALAASSMDNSQFVAYMEDLWAISAQYERARLALLVVQFASHNLVLEDEVERVERIKYVLQSLDSVEEKLHVCQEAIQYMLACCEDDDEEEVDRVLTAHWGRTLCRFVSAELFTASITSSTSTHLLYLDLASSEETFREATEALLLMDSSMISEYATALPQQQVCDFALVESLLCEATAPTSEALDAINDTILVQELRMCCEKSLTRQNIPVGRFRDCPNVLEGQTLVPAVELALELKRRGGAATRRLQLGKRTTTVVPELESFAAMLFREGAYQLALRFKTHVSLHFPTAATEEVKIDYMLATLLRNALEEQHIDECLILGYLLSVTKRDTVVNTLNVQIKRYRYDNEDYSRFERLCWMGKLVADTWKDAGLHTHYSSNEAVFYWFNRLSELNVQFDRVKLFEFSSKEVETVAVQLFSVLFNATEFQPQTREELSSFLLSFRVGDEVKRKQAMTHCLLQVLLNNDEVRLQPNSSAVVWKWCEHDCDLSMLLPELNRFTLDVRCASSCMAKIRLALDILVQAEQDNCEYVSRLLVVELFDSMGVASGFARVLSNAVEETYKLRRAFQSFTEAELVRLVCTGLALNRADFVRKYTQHQITHESDINEVISVIDSIGDGVNETKLQLALDLVDRCASCCHGQLELVRFAHTMFPARNELQVQIEQLECRCIFEDFGLRIPSSVQTPEQLLRVFYEQYNPATSKQQLQHRMFASALTLMRGSLRDWTKALQRCLVDWLQASSLEFDSVAVIVRALQHLQREAHVDAQQFLTGIAFMNSARIKKIAIVRALKALQKFRELTIAEQDLLWMKETEVEMKECAIWKQTIEQVVQTENKPASVRGLLREISQTFLPPEREVKGLQFIAKLIVDFSLYSVEDGVLESCLAQLVQVNALACLEVMLKIPAQNLKVVRDLSIWTALREHTSESKFVVLLERCPFDEFVVDSCNRMLLQQQRDTASSCSRVEMLRRRF